MSYGHCWIPDNAGTIRRIFATSLIELKSRHFAAKSA